LCWRAITHEFDRSVYRYIGGKLGATTCLCYNQSALQYGGTPVQRKSGYIVWLTVVIAVVALFFAWQYLGYRLANRTLPAGMTMAGLSVENMTREQALNALEVAFATPLTVTYQEHQLYLSPDTLELQYDHKQTNANLDAALMAWRTFDGFVSYLLRHPVESKEIPVAVSYSEQRLTRFLDRVAYQYDHPRQEPVALPAALDFRPGQAGSTLNVAASRARLARALVSADTRNVELVVESQEAPQKDIGLLRQLLEARLDDHPGLVPGIFVKDLQTGAELMINAQVAYAGLSVLKIAVLEEAYRSLDQPPSVETTKLISETMTESGNFTANLLLRDVIDDGDSYRAVKKLTTSMNRLGLKNTFMAAPYDEKDVAATITTPANSRTDISTNPDPFIQTTPLDIGLLLEMIYQCSQGGGALMLTYPDTLTADECQEMIKWMSQNRIDNLIEAGVPEDTEVAHKHGWISDTHADAGLVLTAGGDYILVIFLHRPQWLEWEESASLIADISTVAYNYFNPSR
jgi:beta-lactamase class A